MSFIVAANWKLNKGPKEAESFFQEFLSGNEALRSEFETLFFVPAVDLVTANAFLEDTPVGWGPQNIYFEDQGAFTGENSPAVMKDIGATHALVGHSERRHIFKEADGDTFLKMKAAIRNDLIPVLCVGETIEERKVGHTFDVLKRQLSGALKEDVTTSLFHVAYEPVWAIGTGEVASPGQVAEAHDFIYSWMAEHCPQAKGSKILYGGSVKPDNAGELSAVDHVGGFLVGGASLKVESFIDILKACR